MTNFDKKLFTERGKTYASMVIAFALLLLMCVMCGCSKTHYVPVESVRTEHVRTDSALFEAIVKMMRESERSKQNTSDSLIHRIKETTKINADGDTVDHRLIEYVYMSSKEKAEYEKTIAERDDSIVRLNAILSSQKTDSVPVPYPVEKKLTKWENAKMNIGGIAIEAVIAVAVLAFIAWLVKKFRK